MISIDDLQREFLAWLRANCLPSNAGDAEDMLRDATERGNPHRLLDVHCTWLQNFIRRWNQRLGPDPMGDHHGRNE